VGARGTLSEVRRPFYPTKDTLADLKDVLKQREVHRAIAREPPPPHRDGVALASPLHHPSLPVRSLHRRTRPHHGNGKVFLLVKFVTHSIYHYAIQSNTTLIPEQI